MELMTSSRAKDGRACQRLHQLRYLEGYRPAVEAETLRFGSLWHLGLEAWWQSPSIGEALDRGIAAMAGEADPFERAKAEELLRGYHFRWQGEPLLALAVEAPFETELRNPETGRASTTWRLAGKVDGILMDPVNRRKLVIEHKTTSEDITHGSEYWRRLRMDGQVSIYFEGAKALGHEVEACLYDVTKKPTIRPLKATPEADRKYTKATKTEPPRLYSSQREVDETPEEYRARLVEDIAGAPGKYFARGEIVRLEGELADARFDLWQLAQQLRESERAGRFPRNPDSCVRYGRTCPFFEACCGEASLDDPTRFVKLENRHPELAA